MVSELLPGSSQIMLHPLMSDSLRLDVLTEVLGTRDHSDRFSTCTSRRGGQVGTRDLGPRNTAADNGRVVCKDRQQTKLGSVQRKHKISFSF